ncbi:MAG: hypothetical protein GXP32_01625 [Kiritimatiellaeota bacterium]|nr:hypothetical protein [Kiritimatiellota bacterium]
MNIKNIVFIIIGVVIIAGVIFYGIFSFKNKNTNNTVPTQSESVFNGEGRKLNGPVILKKGLTILKAKNQSGVNGFFGVNIYIDKNGNGVLDKGEGYTSDGISVAYKSAEAFDGAIAFKSDGGGYFANVEGGRWQVSFIQPEKLSKPAKEPVSFSGNGMRVTEKFYLPAGKYSFSVTNKGSGNFIVYMIDEDGNSTKRLVNEVDDFDGDFSVNNVFDGNYIFMISGKDWTISKN